MNAEAERLLEDHLWLVDKLARRRLRTVPSRWQDDVRSAGLVGLMQAAEGFDAGRGFKFTTYATWRINGAMTDELRRVHTGRPHLPGRNRTNDVSLEGIVEGTARRVGASPANLLRLPRRRRGRPSRARRRRIGTVRRVTARSPAARSRAGPGPDVLRPRAHHGRDRPDHRRHRKPHLPADGRHQGPAATPRRPDRLGHSGMTDRSALDQWLEDSGRLLDELEPPTDSDGTSDD